MCANSAWVRLISLDIVLLEVLRQYYRRSKITSCVQSTTNFSYVPRGIGRRIVSSSKHWTPKLVSREFPLDWFRSYFCGRSTLIVIDNGYSDSQDMCYGLPQVSIAGPTFCHSPKSLKLILAIFKSLEFTEYN